MSTRRIDRRDALVPTPWWLSAVAVPIVALAAVLTVDGQWRLLFDLPRTVRSQIAIETLLLETALMVIVAPLGGVALMARRLRPRGPSDTRMIWRAWRLAWPLGIGATALAASSALAVRALVGAPADPLQAIVIPHAALWAAAFALGALGALCASVLTDPLDAAACALGLAIAASAGVLVAGPIIGEAPIGAINAALQASPIVAIASAADFDILRMELLYRLSPLAHGRFDYPTWQATCGWYVGLAFALLLVQTQLLDRKTHA